MPICHLPPCQYATCRYANMPSYVRRQLRLRDPPPPPGGFSRTPQPTGTQLLDLKVGGRGLGGCRLMPLFSPEVTKYRCGLWREPCCESFVGRPAQQLLLGGRYEVPEKAHSMFLVPSLATRKEIMLRNVPVTVLCYGGPPLPSPTPARFRRAVKPVPSLETPTCWHSSALQAGRSRYTRWQRRATNRSSSCGASEPPRLVGRPSAG
eukprot:SAG11_NODE_410_length_9703_cov_3.284777_4_plen_207_part_00